MSKRKDAMDLLRAELTDLRKLLCQSPPLTAMLARKDVLRRYGISRTTLYRWLAKGFPKAVRGFWRPSELDAWDSGPDSAGRTLAGQSGQSRPC